MRRHSSDLRHAEGTSGAAQPAASPDGAAESGGWVGTPLLRSAPASAPNAPAGFTSSPPICYAFCACPRSNSCRALANQIGAGTQTPSSDESPIARPLAPCRLRVPLTRQDRRTTGQSHASGRMLRRQCPAPTRPASRAGPAARARSRGRFANSCHARRPPSGRGLCRG